MFENFEVGKRYYCMSEYDEGSKFYFTVVGKTDKTITLENESYERQTIELFRTEFYEYCSPNGDWRMEKHLSSYSF